MQKSEDKTIKSFKKIFLFLVVILFFLLVNIGLLLFLEFRETNKTSIPEFVSNLNVEEEPIQIYLIDWPYSSRSLVLETIEGVYTLLDAVGERLEIQTRNMDTGEISQKVIITGDGDLFISELTLENEI